MYFVACDLTKYDTGSAMTFGLIDSNPRSELINSSTHMAVGSLRDRNAN